MTIQELETLTPEAIEKMSALFDTVADPSDWKNPIDATVDYSDSLDELNEILEAIRFYTATEPEISAVHNTDGGLIGFQVSSEGYRSGPAGP